MAEMDIVPYIGTRTPADFDTLFDELEAARGSSASLSDAIAEKADNATTLSGYGITDAYTKTETDTALSGKQGELSQSQLAAVNSGITAEKLADDEAALVEVVDAGAKNRFDPASAWDSKTAYGVTITRNGDTYSIASGTTKSGDNNYINMGYQANTNLIPAGDWVLTFDTPQQNVRLQAAWNGTVSATSSYGGSCFFTVPENTTDSWFRIVLRGNTNMAGTSFKIMLCPRILWDVSHQFEPYALSNPIITPAAIKAVDEGAKNLFDYAIIGPNTTNIGTSVVVNGVRFNMNSDKSVTITREASSSQDSYVWFRHSDGSAVIVTDFCDDVHVFSGAAGASVSTYRLYISNINGSNTYKYFGDEGIIGTPQVTPNAAGIFIAAGYSPSNLVIKPMICTLADWNVSQKYVPYAPTNRELYERDKVIEISNAITAETGYAVESSTHLYYQNKQVFGTIAIAINSGSYSSSLTAIAKLPVEYAPARQYFGSCGFSTDQWAITNIGYAFIQGANASSTAQRGQISVKSPTANLTHMILNVCYPVQIDGTF